MISIGFITNLRAPYRTIQLNHFSNIDNTSFTVYYCEDKKNNRNWETGSQINFHEIDLNVNNKNFLKVFQKSLSIIKENDLILLGGYDKTIYIFISVLSKILKKNYVLIFDGISTNRVYEKENFIKKSIKGFVIKNANFIMGNGSISKDYFSKQFNYPKEKILNQYLTVDCEKIDSLYSDKTSLRKEYRKKLGIAEDDKVLIYSGRLIDIKNVDSVIKAISHPKCNDIILLITGGGKLEDEIKSLSEELNVRTIITGFIHDQEELFKHYYAGDALILPSIIEPWGLVINEAMCSGLPVLVSDKCGCSCDLVHQGLNGYLIEPEDIEDISLKIYQLMYNDDLLLSGKYSKDIIKEWTFSNSQKNLKYIIEKLM